MSVNEMIKKLRKEKGWTQKELADKLGSHISHVNRMETKKFDPSLKVLLHLAKVFDVPIDYLVTGNEDALEDVKIGDKSLAEKIKLIDSLDDEERKALSTMIDAMLTKKKMKEFLQKELEPA